MRRWDEEANKRADGLFVINTASSGWVIMPGEAVRVAAMTHCPCCGKSFLTAAVARRVADMVYPLGNHWPDSEDD